jgi:uncharacterized protein (TIGR03435 family)
MKRVFAGMAFIALLSCAVFGQTPTFGIADVHASAAAANSLMRGGVVRSGIYRIQTATMVDLIGAAYNVGADKVLGGPSWLELDRFDVYAKVPPSTLADTPRLMLQGVLADRFKLALHKDTRPLPGFALTVRKGVTPKLKPADSSDSTGCKSTPLYTDAELAERRQAAIQAGGSPLVLQPLVYTCRNMTMGDFAEGMRKMPGAQQYFDTGAVVDQTGLKGAWDFTFQYTPKPALGIAPPVSDDIVTIFDAIDKQLGLKLEAAKIPTPVLVVDSVNRKPTDNPPNVNTILPPPPPAEFEAAALRLSDPTAPEVRSAGPQPGGRFEVRNFPLILLIRLAWGLNGAGVDLTGSPPWLNSVRIDLSAKLPATDATSEVTGVMDMDAFLPALKALLIERFKVAIHTEQQPVPGYALVAAKPKMQKANPAARTKCKEGPGADGKDPRIGNLLLSRLVTCQNMTMAEFTQQLPGLSGGSIRGAVMDATGIDGAYDFTLSFSGRNVSPAQAALSAGGTQAEATVPDGGISIFDALEKQLGLKLEKRNIPMPVVILDRIEQKPTDN